MRDGGASPIPDRTKLSRTIALPPAPTIAPTVVNAAAIAFEDSVIYTNAAVSILITWLEYGMPIAATYS